MAGALQAQLAQRQLEAADSAALATELKAELRAREKALIRLEGEALQKETALKQELGLLETEARSQQQLFKL